MPTSLRFSTGLAYADRMRGPSISSLALPAHSHTLNFSHPAAQPAPQAQQVPPPLPPNPYAHTLQLTGTEQRPKRGDGDYIKRAENAFILFRRECCLRIGTPWFLAPSEPSLDKRCGSSNSANGGRERIIATIKCELEIVQSSRELAVNSVTSTNVATRNVPLGTPEN
ncbi:hypothetical protein ACEPAI_3923 [Sanghuangporus weigelae]